MIRGGRLALATPIAKFFGAKFVRQDQIATIQQAEGSATIQV